MNTDSPHSSKGWIRAQYRALRGNKKWNSELLAKNETKNFRCLAAYLYSMVNWKNVAGKHKT